MWGRRAFLCSARTIRTIRSALQWQRDEVKCCTTYTRVSTYSAAVCEEGFMVRCMACGGGGVLPRTVCTLRPLIACAHCSHGVIKHYVVMQCCTTVRTQSDFYTPLEKIDGTASTSSRGPRVGFCCSKKGLSSTWSARSVPQ